MLNPHIFRAYDVRGRVGEDINAGVFRRVGRAYATLVRRRGGRRVAVGQDNRLSSAELKAGFVEGVRAAGVDVVDIGTVTTPILYFATAHWGLDGGANITGSHNPIEYNGVKMVHAGAAPLTEDEIQSLRTVAEAGDDTSGDGGIETRSPREDSAGRRRRSAMGEVRITARLTNAFDESLLRRGMLASDQVRSYEADAVVDTGSTHTVLPPDVAERLGLAIRGQWFTYVADGRGEEVSVTESLLVEIDGRDTTDEALVLGDQVLIGQTVLEKLNLLVDCDGGRLIPNPRQPASRV